MSWRARVILWGVLMIAVAEFIVRGPVRAVSASGGAGDFAAPYAAARAWRVGANPYDRGALARILIEAGHVRDDGDAPYMTASVYPPPTLALLSPLTIAGWTATRVAWLVLIVGSVGAMVLVLLKESGTSLARPAGLLLAASVLALAPLHTGIARGQLAIPSIAATVCALAWLRRSAHGPAALGLALATLLKPQIGAPFLLYALARSRWRAAIPAATVCIAIAIVSVAALEARSIDWLWSWRANLQSEIVGGDMDPVGALSVQMLDLRPLLALFLGRSLGSGMAVTVGALFVVVWLWIARRTSDRLLVPSGLAVAALLTGYHRFYDAGLLALILAWATREIAHRRSHRRAALTVLVLSLPFAIPGAVVLQRLADGGALPGILTASTLWDAVLLRHQTWALIGMEAVLLAAALTKRKPVAWPPVVAETRPFPASAMPTVTVEG